MYSNCYKYVSQSAVSWTHGVVDTQLCKLRDTSSVLCTPFVNLASVFASFVLGYSPNPSLATLWNFGVAISFGKFSLMLSR